MKHLLKTVLTLGSAALVTSGCSDSTLDFRNAEISNGSIFSNQANTPFTGFVTNLPNQRLALDLKFSDTLAAIFKIVRQHGGLNQSFYYRNLTCNSEVKDGHLSGLSTCFIPNSGIKRYEAHYSDGKLDGDFEVYTADGTSLLAKGMFKDGKPEGELNVYSPNNGRLVRRGNTTNGLVDGLQEQWDEATGELASRVQATNGQFVGLLETWSPEGHKTSEVPFVNGMRNGIARSWDPKTGVLTQEVTYVDNAMHGPTQKWSSDGTLISSGSYNRNAYYEDPKPQATSQRGQTSDDRPVECVDLWIAAFRTENGEDTLIRSEQLGEWSDWCDEGRRP